MPSPRQWTSGKARRSTGLFERPKRRDPCLHVLLCIAGYSIIHVGAIFANKNVCWARVIVGLWCAAVGVVIGSSLLAYVSRFPEAASGSQSSILGNSGSRMKLKYLARNADEPASVTGGLLLLLRRTTSRGTSGSARKSYEYVIPSTPISTWD